MLKKTLSCIALTFLLLFASLTIHKNLYASAGCEELVTFCATTCGGRPDIYFRGNDSYVICTETEAPCHDWDEPCSFEV